MDRLVEKYIEDAKPKKAKTKKTVKLLSFKVLYSLNLGSNPDGSAKESYKFGKTIHLHPVDDKKKIEKLKNLKII